MLVSTMKYAVTNSIIAAKEKALKRIAAMSATGLGTLPVIYAVDEQQNPLPRKPMLFEGDTNNTGGRNDVSPSS